MSTPEEFTVKSAAQIQEELLGFPAACIEAALRYQASGAFADFTAMLPGMITFHLPRGAAPLPDPLEDTVRLHQDLGLDSLSLTEMAFKLDDVFGVSLETTDMIGVVTVGDLKTLLQRKLDAP